MSIINYKDGPGDPSIKQKKKVNIKTEIPKHIYITKKGNRNKQKYKDFLRRPGYKASFFPLHELGYFLFLKENL